MPGDAGRGWQVNKPGQYNFENDRETILANADAENVANAIWDNQAKATRAKEKLDESDYAAIFATIPDGKKLEMASRLEDKVVFSTTVKD